MKIAQFIASMGQGGAEKIFRDLCNALSKQHEVTVICYPNPFIVDHLDPHIRTVIIPKRSRHNPLTYLSLHQVLRQEHFDVVHTHSAKASGIIHTLSRFFPVRQAATKHNPRKGPVFDKIQHVVAVSKKVADTIARPSTLIYNGIVPETVQPDEQQHRPFKILAIGRLEPIKGFDLLIEQIAPLKENLQLEIIGDGPCRAPLQDLITRTGQSDRIHLAGFQTDIAERMSRADLVIISSHSEGFSLVLVEALFYANLLISTPVGIAPEILDQTLLIEPEKMGEKIAQIIADPSAFRQHFESIRQQHKERFSIQSTADAYTGLYQTICATADK